MFYSLRRANKQIIGPSVRFAEIVAPCWRNCAVGARSIGEGDKTITSQGIFIDYEANLRNSVEVPRRISDKDGKRFSDDMIVITMNAAMSVARRNAILKGGVPQALWTPAYEAAQLTAVGKAESHAQRVASAMEYLNKLGVTEWQILNAVGVASPKELETEHLVTMRVLLQEIKRGDKTIEQVFGSPYDKEIEILFAQLKMNAAQQTMLRNSYMGRAAELAAYLKERVGSPRPSARPPEQPPAATVTTVQPESVPQAASSASISFAYGANPDDNPGKPDDSAHGIGIAAAHQQKLAEFKAAGIEFPEVVPENEFTEDGEHLTIPDSTPIPPARQDDPATAQQIHYWTNQPTMPEPPAPLPPTAPGMSGTPVNKEPFRPSTPQAQTTMEPRRRGRPTREEAARKAAGTTPATPQSSMFTETPDEFQF